MVIIILVSTLNTPSGLEKYFPEVLYSFPSKSISSITLLEAN
jgi:hypothetical protein